MGIFDALSGKSLKRAYGNAADVARDNRNLNATLLSGAFDTAGNELRFGAGHAINALNEGLASGRDTIEQYDARGLEALASGQSGAREQLALARGAAGRQGDAFSGLEALATSYGPGRQTYLDALGLAGEEGLGRARDAFGNTLQTDFEIDQGLDAINRARNARGGTVSGGNIDRDAMLFGQGLANSRTSQYLDRLAGLADRELAATGTAAGGRAQAAGLEAGLFGAEADLINQGGINAANLASQTGGRLTDLTTNTQTNIANLQTGLGQGLANLALGRGGALADVNNRFAEASQTASIGRGQADNQASANALNFGINIAKLGAGAAGSFGGGAPGVPTNSGFGGGFFGLPT